MFCVSSSLMCDGIHHCPPGDEYNSDEDPVMCARQRGISDTNVMIYRRFFDKNLHIFDQIISIFPSFCVCFFYFSDIVRNEHLATNIEGNLQ